MKVDAHVAAFSPRNHLSNTLRRTSKPKQQASRLLLVPVQLVRMNCLRQVVKQQLWSYAALLDKRCQVWSTKENSASSQTQRPTSSAQEPLDHPPFPWLRPPGFFAEWSTWTMKNPRGVRLVTCFWVRRICQTLGNRVFHTYRCTLLA